MRLWSLHPRYLDVKGLVALWREALLAQKVLLGQTRGYRNHPQLQRFKMHADPPQAIAAYLTNVQAEATRRGYRFDARKILQARPAALMDVTVGQVAFEREHLLAKLRMRAATDSERLAADVSPELHPLFRLVPGGIAPWEVRGIATSAADHGSARPDVQDGAR
jgi:hypothetical protein